MSNKFEKGDVVRLKSGGPKMTVAGYSGESVQCSWFAGAKKQRGGFNEAMLEKADEKKKDE